VRIEGHDNSSILNIWSQYAGLRELNKPVDLIQLPKASHLLVHPQEDLQSVEGNIDWFDFWLNGHEDPNPAKADQYQRWRVLRNLQKVHG